MSNKLTDDQKRIVDTLDRPLFVAAGAGSGKSTTLAERVCQAFLPGSDGKPPYLESLDQVLVITFTHAAADEIKEKIRARLREAGLTDLALQVDSAWISTIHGMCARILRRHALDLGLDPRFTLISETDADDALEKAIDGALAKVRTENLYVGLRQEFDLRGGKLGRDGKERDSGGSVFGMVKSLRNSAANATKGFDSIEFPGSVPQVDSEARDLLPLVAEVKEKGTEKDNKGHAAFDSPKGKAELTNLEDVEKALNRYLGLPQEARADGRADLLHSIPEKPGDAYRSNAMKPYKSQLTEAYASLREKVAFAQAVSFADQLVEIARGVDARYRAEKLARGVLDNDDLISLTLKVFDDHPEMEEEYSKQFKLVMVDEFQDTNAQQEAIIMSLSGPGACHLCTVGDAQQSIYRFRAADPRVFNDRADALRDAGEESTVELKKNFRSHADVLKLVEKLFSKSSGNELMPGFMSLEPDEKRKDGLKTDIPRADLELVTTGSNQASSAELAAVAAEMVAQRIAECVEGGQPADDVVLLLGRMTNAAAYVDAIRRHGLDCVVSGGSTFYKTEEVILVASMLHFLACPEDTESGLFPLLESDLFRLSVVDLCLLGTKAQAPDGAHAKRPIDVGLLGLDLPGGVQPSARLAAAHEVLSRALSRVDSWRIQDILLGIMRESGWLARLEAQGPEGLAKAANALAAARFVAELADEHAMGPVRAAWEYDHWLEVSKEGPKSLVGGASGAVRVMTIHASKGLEFPVVAISDCWGSLDDESRSPVGVTTVNRGEKIFAALVPSGIKRKELVTQAPGKEEDCETREDWARYLVKSSDDEELAERARLLYVAITRAREAVILAMPVTVTSAKCGTRLEEKVLKALLGRKEKQAEDNLPDLPDLPPVGESPVDYGGSSPCRVRRVALALDKGDSAVGEVGTVVKVSRRDLVMYTDGGFTMGDPSAERAGDGEGRTFTLYDQAVEDGLAYGLGRAVTWQGREGVFSYSSARQQMGEGDAGEYADARAPEGASSSPDKPAVKTAPKGTMPAHPKVVPVGGDGAEPGDSAPETGDSDKATDLGSAFHELAQVLVETGRDLTPERVRASERYWRLSKRARARLEAALSRWQGSDIRAEALGLGQVRAEVPFFCKVDAEYGSYVEGAIDLLATDPGSSSALVIDYKTGDMNLALEQIRARHAMQANFYAHVLMRQGFDEVRCAFVCVERDAAEFGGAPGQPVVAAYAFGRDNPPRI